MTAFRSMTAVFLVAAVILVLVLTGGAIGGYVGAGVGLLVGLILGVIPWRGHPAWVWCGLYLRRKRAVALSEPVTVASDRASGGVRYQDGTAVVAVQVVDHREVECCGGCQFQHVSGDFGEASD